MRMVYNESYKDYDTRNSNRHWFGTVIPVLSLVAMIGSIAYGYQDSISE